MLSELADLSHAEIADVIDVPRAKVKALVHQARTRLLAERDARELPCEQVREQLSTASGGELRRGPLRRHLSHCEGCSAYRDAVRDQRAALGLVLPVLPSAGLKEAILGTISGGGAGGAVAVGGAALSGGGTVGMAAKGIGAKLAIGAALAGGGAAAVKEVADEPRAPVAPASVVRATTPAPPVRDKTTERRARTDAQALRTAARAPGKPDKASARRVRADAKALRAAAKARRKAAKERRMAAKERRTAAKGRPAKGQSSPGRSKQAERRAGTPAKAKPVKAVRAKPVKTFEAKPVKPVRATPAEPVEKLKAARPVQVQRGKSATPKHAAKP